MTLEKAKEIIAEKHYGSMYKWDDLFDDIKLRLMDEVSFLYAHSKWDQACDLQRKSCGGKVLWGRHLIEIEKDVYNAPKPEFK